MAFSSLLKISKICMTDGGMEEGDDDDDKHI
jgi:hypothetical protein